jgi:hypothetical protein
MNEGRKQVERDAPKATMGALAGWRANAKFRAASADEPLSVLLERASPLPWKACGNGNCPCGVIWSATADHPVATAQRGEWGDEHIAMRFVDENGEKTTGASLGTVRVEAYMDMLAYGRLPDDAEKHNSALIAAAVNAVPRMLAMEAALKRITDESFEDAGQMSASRYREIARAALSGEKA